MSPLDLFIYDGATGQLRRSGAPPESPPPPVGQPVRANTGWVAAGSPALTSYAPGTYAADNITLTNREINGTVTFTGDNVHLIGCKVNGELKFRPGNDHTVENTDCVGLIFDGSTNFRATRVYTTGAIGVDGLQIKGDSGVRPTDGLIEACYLGNPKINSGSHYDTVQVRGASRLEFIGNNFDQAVPFSDRYNATLFLENALGGNDDILVDGNWTRAAGYYHFRLFATNIIVRNNIFLGKSAQASPLIGSSYPIQSLNNKWEDGTTAIPDGLVD